MLSTSSLSFSGCQLPPKADNAISTERNPKRRRTENSTNDNAIDVDLMGNLLETEESQELEFIYFGDETDSDNSNDSDSDFEI